MSVQRRMRYPAAPGSLCLETVLAELVEVRLCTAAGPAWRTDSAFLLICANGRSHVVHSADPAATALIARLRVRPGFDADRVLGPEGPVRSRMLTVWRRPGSRRGIDGPCIPAPRSVTGPGGRSR
jgi:hypothetical protein